VIDADYGEWLSRGQAHQLAGRPVDAMLCYRRALKSNRNAVQVQFHLGEVWRELGRSDDAAAAWHKALTWQPRHVPSLVALGDMLRRGRDLDQAIPCYRRALAVEPQHASARRGLTLSLLAASDVEPADAFSELSVETMDETDWQELGQALTIAARSTARRDLLARIEPEVTERVPILLGLAAEDAAGSGEDVRRILDRADAIRPPIDDPDALRRLAIAAAATGIAGTWPARYAARAAAVDEPTLPSLWPRRTAGDAIRVAFLVAPQRPLAVGDAVIAVDEYLRKVAMALPGDRFAVAIVAAGPQELDRDLPVIAGDACDPGMARAMGEADYDAIIDLSGMPAQTGPLLAARPARSLWTYRELAGAHVAPLVTHALPPLVGGSDEATLADHAHAIAATLIDACAGQPWFVDRCDARCDELQHAWRGAVGAHQSGDTRDALLRYRAILDQQPRFAPAHYFLGTILRDRGERAAAMVELAAAVAGAPRYSDARIALANLQREQGLLDASAATCREGIDLTPAVPGLWRALGLAQLAQHDGESAVAAFEKALALASTDAQTHYNMGVALHMSARHQDALRAYQRALVFDPKNLAAEFNIGVVFQQLGRLDAAAHAFEQVLDRDPEHVPAHKALGDVLLAGRQIDKWFRAFQRFETHCPRSLCMAVRALEVYQYRGDFTGLDRYLDRLRKDEFVASSATDLADCLEQLLFLLLYFDIDPEMHLAFYRAYDAVAAQVYGTPMTLPAPRRPGRLRVGYLSGDLRDHVMGKMMWEAVRHHDRDALQLFFYATVSDSDDWTERFRELGLFAVVSNLDDRRAAQRIADDDLDILVDLSTHTKGSRPGILALKPARVQITHVASSGVVGLSSIDFKLTDAYADLPENQKFVLEALLPMQGCAYPYRHVAPAVDHPFIRERLGIAADTFVIGAFVNPMKLSRRGLSLWREILDRAPRAVLAISPQSPDIRPIYARLLAMSGIALDRVILLPQGRDDAENRARYQLVDMVVDPLPYGGVNGTLEALDMGVPVVTLCGRKHSERTSYSILSNLGVTQTIAHSGSEYVQIAVRLANDRAFFGTVKAAIRAGIASSPLTDMQAYARHLEAAYREALRQISITVTHDMHGK
jgi:protein O-GlcNAc transferase